MKKRNFLTVAMIIFSLALAGCGGSESGDSDVSEKEEKVEEKKADYFDKSYVEDDSEEILKLYEDKTVKVVEPDGTFYNGSYEKNSGDDYTIYINGGMVNIVGTFEIDGDELTLYHNDKVDVYHEIED